MSVQQVLGEINGKDEAASLLIAQRVGKHLCDDVIADADRRAAEMLARALINDAIESVRSELRRAVFETGDAIEVLSGAGRHPTAIGHLEKAKRLIRKANASYFLKRKLVRDAIAALGRASAEIVEAS
jgi:hypothetical protein